MDDPGVHPYREWIRLGVSRADLARGLKDGRYRRLRRGWYGREGADADIVTAVTKGGALSCVSALRRRGVWVPPQFGKVHIRGDKHAGDAHPKRFCRQVGGPQPVLAAVDEPLLALRHALHCLDHESITVVCDSLLNTARRALADEPVLAILTRTEVESAFEDAPAAVRDCLDRCDDRAASGTETMVRLRLRSKGVQVQVQAPIEGLGHVDLLVGERLIIEVDSVKHHTGVQQYREDRRRDQVAATLGLLRMRLTYENVVDEWDDTLNTILSVVRQGLHRAPRHREKPV